MKKDLLQDLLIYKSSNHDDYITLRQYFEEKKADQKTIYYATGASKEAIMNLPQMDAMKKNEFDVLILTDNIDEFALQMINKYEDMDFKPITAADLDVSSAEDKKKVEDLKKEQEPLLNKLKEVLKDKVEDVRFSTRLVDSPVCLASSEGMSFGMEKAINELPNQEKVKTGRILELNPNHDLLKAIEKVYTNNPDDINEYASLLFNQALLIEGLPLENPSEFSKQMVDLMIKSAK